MFAIRIVKLSQYLQDNKREFVLSKQVLRSGTAIGALVREASSGQASEIQADKSPVRILVIPTEEEFEIAKQTCEVIPRGN